MANIHYLDDPLDISEGTQGAIWRRTWRADGIVATNIVDAIAELFTALPDRGTSVPAPLNPNMRVIENRVSWIGPLDGANGEAKGSTTNSTPVDSITAAPPESATPDTGPGITLAGRGYVQQDTFSRARPEGSATVEQIMVQWSDGVDVPTPVRAPVFGEAFSFSRTEENNPRATLRNYRGKVNSSTWNGYAADQVCLVDAIFETVNGGEYYNVTYEFVALPNGWVVEVLGRDRTKGNVPITNPTAVQRKFYVPYDRADFGPLNIVLD